MSDRLPRHSPWSYAARATAALARRWVSAGSSAHSAALSAADGANLATANWTGYFVGTLTGTLAPARIRSPALLRTSLVVLTGSGRVAT